MEFDQRRICGKFWLSKVIPRLRIAKTIFVDARYVVNHRLGKVFYRGSCQDWRNVKFYESDYQTLSVTAVTIDGTNIVGARYILPLPIEERVVLFEIINKIVKSKCYLGYTLRRQTKRGDT